MLLGVVLAARMVSPLWSGSIEAARVILLSCGQNLLRKLIASKNLCTTCLSVGVGMLTVTRTVTGLGCRPSVVIP